MNILLTSGARRIDFVTFFQEALRKLDIQGRVIVTDPDPSAPALQLADVALATPHQTETAYMETIFAVCRKYQVNLLISINDWEVPKYAANKQALEEMGVTVFVPDSKVVDKMRDKNEYRSLLEPLGVKAPYSYLTVERALEGLADKEVTYPLIVKPRNGSASAGVTIVHNEEDLRFAYKEAVDTIKNTPIGDDTSYSPEDNITIQEVIDGRKFSVDVFNDARGNYITTLLLEQEEMRGGDVDKAISIKNEELEALGRKVGENLKHAGYINMDVFYNGEDYYVIDINPRFGGSYALSHAAGVDIPAAYIALTAGREIKQEWLEEKINVELARYDSVIAIDRSKIKNSKPDQPVNN